jgi:hypothetical protein
MPGITQRAKGSNAARYRSTISSSGEKTRYRGRKRRTISRFAYSKMKKTAPKMTARIARAQNRVQNTLDNPISRNHMMSM